MPAIWLPYKVIIRYGYKKQTKKIKKLVKHGTFRLLKALRLSRARLRHSWNKSLFKETEWSLRKYPVSIQRQTASLVFFFDIYHIWMQVISTWVELIIRLQPYYPEVLSGIQVLPEILSSLDLDNSRHSIEHLWSHWKSSEKLLMRNTCESLKSKGLAKN